MLNDKRAKYIDKWGNKSRVGSFITELSKSERRKNSQALPNLNVYRNSIQKQVSSRLSQGLIQKAELNSQGKEKKSRFSIKSTSRKS